MVKTTKKLSLKPQRIFSIELKKQVVRDIESGKCSVREASREVGVWHQTVYTWLNKYSRYLKSGKQMVVQNKSESYKSKELEKRVKDLEASLGCKFMEIELLEKIIEIAGEEYGVDLKKTILKKLSSGSGSTKESNTDLK